MRILAASDLHRDLTRARSLVQRSAGVDVVVIAGDLCTMHQGLDEVVGVLREMPAPCVLVAGNNETVEELRQSVERASWDGAHVLHGQGVRIQGQDFFGLGGGVPITPFGAWSWDLSEDEARALLAAMPRGCVLVSHSPPQGAGDRTSAGEHVGSVALREAIERCDPVLVVCGHIHDSWGFDGLLGTSRVLNAGPEGVAVEL